MNAADFQTRNEATWQRLADLLQRAHRDGLRQLSEDETAELGRLYRKATADLAKARVHGVPEPVLRWLNETCGRARSIIYRRKAEGRTTLRARMLRVPGSLGALRQALWLAFGAMLFGLMAGFLATHDQPALARLLIPADGSGLSWGTLVRLSGMGLVGGSLLGVGALVVLATGTAGVGAALATTAAPAAFLDTLLPPAAPALVASLIAGAVGWHVGWSLVAPGPMFRRDACALALRQGLLPLLVAASLIGASLLLGFAFDRFPLPLPARAALGLGIAVMPAMIPVFWRRR